MPPTWLLAPAQGGEREANRMNGCVNTMLSTSQEGHLSPWLFHPVFILSDVYLTGLQVSRNLLQSVKTAREVCLNGTVSIASKNNNPFFHILIQRMGTVAPQSEAASPGSFRPGGWSGAIHAGKCAVRIRQVECPGCRAWPDPNQSHRRDRCQEGTQPGACRAARPYLLLLPLELLHPDLSGLCASCALRRQPGLRLQQTRRLC